MIEKRIIDKTGYIDRDSFIELTGFIGSDTKGGITKEEGGF